MDHLARLQREAPGRGGAAPDGAIAALSTIFNNRSTEPSIELAEKLLKIVPKGLGKVLFANSGSEANDQAVKLVWYYNNALGRPRKKKVIARVRGYHGITVFAGSLTGQPANHADFDLPLGGVLRTDCPSHYLYGLPGESEAAFVERIVANLERHDPARRAGDDRRLHRRAGQRRPAA